MRLALEESYCGKTSPLLWDLLNEPHGVILFEELMGCGLGVKALQCPASSFASFFGLSWSGNLLSDRHRKHQRKPLRRWLHLASISGKCLLLWW